MIKERGVKMTGGKIKKRGTYCPCGGTTSEHCFTAAAGSLHPLLKATVPFRYTKTTAFSNVGHV